MNNKIPLTQEYVSIRDAELITGITAQTLRKMGDNKQIVCYKTPSGQRKFQRASLLSFCSAKHTPKYNTNDAEQSTKKNFIYARVSSHTNASDLTNQINIIKQTDSRFQDYIEILDVCNGVDFKQVSNLLKKQKEQAKEVPFSSGIKTILNESFQNNIGEVVVLCRDRISRVNYDLIETIITNGGGFITVINDEYKKNYNNELNEDLMHILTSY